MSESTAAARYVMGHNDRERRRLQLQASVINPLTEHLFQRAGIRPGMRVLDIGSGVGDVALIASRMVGTSGSVTAVDLDADALSTAAERAASEGIGNIRFHNGDVASMKFAEPFDAVTGRHILIHMPDPEATLRDVAKLVRQGGLVVFQEYDFDAIYSSSPELPLRDSAMRIVRDFFGGLGRHAMGARLYSLFIRAGLNAPDCRGEFALSGGPDSPSYEIFTEALRSILPKAISMGVPGAADIEIDTFEQRLREECVASGTCSAFPTMIGAFAMRP